MAVDNIGLETFAEALIEQGFSRTDEFGLFVTYERANDPLKIHIGPDGSFAAFDGNDEVVTEGNGCARSVLNPRRQDRASSSPCFAPSASASALSVGLRWLPIPSV